MTEQEQQAGCGCQIAANGDVFVDHCVCPKPVDWIPSYSIEARPQQLAGKSVELVSKSGGGWYGTVTEFDQGDRNYTLADGRAVTGLGVAPFTTEKVWLYDIARARIVETP